MPKLETEVDKENYTMVLQEKKYMKKSRRNLYIALEDLDLLFDESEVNRYKKCGRKAKESLKSQKSWEDIN